MAGAEMNYETWRAWFDYNRLDPHFDTLKAAFDAGRAEERDSVAASLRAFADMLVKVCDDEGGLDSDAAVIGFARAFADKIEAQK